MPRVCKLTPELEKRLLDAIRAGNYVETAVAYVGISKETYYKWLRRGAKGEAKFKAFADAVMQCQAESEARDVAIIGSAAVSQWQAAAWRLERKHPERWGRKDRVEMEARHSGDITLKLEWADSWSMGDADVTSGRAV